MKHVNKNESQRQLPNHMNYYLSIQIMVVLPPNFLDSDASIWYVHLAHASTTKAPYLISCESPHLYQTQEVEILVPISIWVHGGQKQIELKHYYLQNLQNLIYQSKILQDGFCGHNVYMRILQQAYSDVSVSMVCICMPWGLCMNM